MGDLETDAEWADRLVRDAVGIDLNPAYVTMQTERITGDAPLFANLSTE